MKTRLIPILTVAATAGSAFTAFADLEQRDSSQFTHKYEMVALPTAEDVDGSGKYDFDGGGTWFTLGTGVNVGSCSMVMSGGQYLKADASSNGAVGDVWRVMNATAGEGGTGYTVEARLKVTESTGAIGAMLLNASTGDSSINSWLVFSTDALYWGNATDRKLMDIDATAWHDYRIVRVPGSILHSVYVDGTLVADDLPNGISASVNRIIMGSTGGTYKGKAQVAWLRFTKGAYAPVDQKAVEKANRLDSTEFDVKYEMNANDNIPTSTSTSDWTINGASGATIVKNGGVLSVTPNSKQPYWLSTDATWKNNILAGTAFTVEFAVQPKSCTISNADRTMQFVAGIPNATSVLNVGTNHVYWQATDSNDSNILLDSSDNSDKMHKFRIAYDGKSTHGFTVWRDDVKIGEALVGNQKWNSLHYVRFGIPGKNQGGNFDIDYVRWKIGGVYTPDTRKGLMVIVK